MTLGRVVRALVTALACAAAASGAGAQGAGPGVAESPILTLDQERLFRDSLFGRRILFDFEARRVVLAAENRAIEEELTEEERDLTELRPSISAGDFRGRAAAFDAKVVAARTRQDGKERDLALALDRGRRLFFRETLPILAGVVRETGAVAILDSRTVIMSSSAVDVTDLIIERVDAALGTGPGLGAAWDGEGFPDGEDAVTNGGSGE